ncbi:hypothetical protein [Sporosarcina globispora]|uniref:hypothetical protein n=1 Tax=Sporosarcina globispora TaxID=1459 RepID=UPI000B2EE65B|nr:hypothetical protein [Sporosarcina globispora]
MQSNKDCPENNVHDVYSVERILTRGKELAVNVKINHKLLTVMTHMWYSSCLRAIEQ